jgi:polygalacturonase
MVISLVPYGCSTRHDGQFNVRRYGAYGDGKHLDTDSINQAISAAADAGGGTVTFPAGNYLSFSIHLRSNVALYLDAGAVIVAATPENGIGYDPPEANLAGVPDKKHEYQDFGHSHWHNSLIWGENLQNIAILGPGKIFGQGLVRALPHALHPSSRNVTDIPQNDSADAAADNDGVGNKAIALKLCRNVILRDFTIQHGGWFGILTTGVDNLTIDNIKIDTNRDGMDIDACQNVRIFNCTVNSPHDDGICPKSSFALGYARPTKNVTISNCQVSGYVEGSLLDGTYKHDPKSRPTGRIKFGTESNGGFENITISNCVFDYCCGLALETVDGATLEDVSISNITMRDIANAPIFIRLGARMRGPAGMEMGTCQRINISNITVYNADPKQCCIISGIPGYDINQLQLSNIRLYFRGGGTRKLATSRPAENEQKYPEPSMFGDMPAYGFFIRHARNVEIDHIVLSTLTPDARSPFLLSDLDHVEFDHVQAARLPGVPMVRMRNVHDFHSDLPRGG